MCVNEKWTDRHMHYIIIQPPHHIPIYNLDKDKNLGWGSLLL